MSQKVIIVIGPPGSGKGTQAELLASKLNLFHLETSKIIEINLAGAKKNDFVLVKGKKYYLLDELKKRESGDLMSPPLIDFWVQSKIKELARERKGVVLSGSPRTVYEGERLTPVLKKLYGSKNIKVTLLNLSAKETIWRNSHRKTCQLMRHSILFTKETKNLKKCPFDGSKLLTRKDDNPEVIKNRIVEYKERTAPLIRLFKKQGLKIKTINGEQSVADVFKDVLKAVNAN